MKDEIPLNLKNNTVDVQNLTPHFNLCCKDRAPCILCLVIEINIHLDEELEDEGHSGLEEDYREETRNPRGTN